MNALIATIVGFVCGGAIPGVLGLLGYLKADQEPETAKKFTKWAWIAFGIIWALGIVLVILYFIIIFAAGGSSGAILRFLDAHGGSLCGCRRFAGCQKPGPI